MSTSFLRFFTESRKNFKKLKKSLVFSFILICDFYLEVLFMQRMTGLLRRCIDDYKMIEAGDKIAVGVSGGKDSLTLLRLMAALRAYYPKPFELEAVTIDLGFPNMDFSPVEKLCEELNVPFTIVPTQIQTIIFDYRKEKNPCSMCAKMRRGALNEAIKQRGISKIALGHHYDDAVETFLMSLIYEGRISCFQPVTNLDRTGVIQIRPMLYIEERDIRSFAKRMELPVVENECPADKNTKREEIKALIKELSATYPGLKNNVFGAMQRYPLAEWGVTPHKRSRSAESEK